MLEKPQITRTTAQTLAVIHETVPRAQIGSVMGPGLDSCELRKYMTFLSTVRQSSSGQN